MRPIPKSISLKESSQSKASTHMRNLKYKGKYPNYERPNNRNMCLRKRKPSYTLLNMDNLTMGNQIFKLSYHLLYYFMNLYSHVLIILNPPLPPLNGNRNECGFRSTNYKNERNPNHHTMIPRERFPVEIGRRSAGETGLTFLTRSLVIYNPDDTVDKSTEVGPIIRSRFRVQRDLKFRKSKMEKSLRF